MNETLDQEVKINDDKLKINQVIIESLKTAANWTKFLAIIGFIVIGLMYLGAVIVLVQVSGLPSGFGIVEQFVVTAIVYIVMASLFIIPTLNMLRFSNHTNYAIANKTQVDLEVAFANLKGFFKFMGIYTIVVLGLYVIIIFFAFMARF